MRQARASCPPACQPPIEARLRGEKLLKDMFLNRGYAFQVRAVPVGKKLG